MMGGRRASMIPDPLIPTPSTLSNIKQGRVLDIFRTTSMYCTISPTISSFVGRVAGLGPISKSTITNNSISCKIQQYNIFTLVEGGILAGKRPMNIAISSA